MKNNQTVSVCGKELTRIEYKGELVMTTAQLAEFYGCTPEHIRDNFRKNKDRFVEGKHFFRLEGEALAEFIRGGYTEIFRSAPRYKISALMLWTKRGAARHAKILNTDVAWDVFEALEDAYFANAETAKPPFDADSSDNREVIKREVELQVEIQLLKRRLNALERAKELCRLADYAEDTEIKELLHETANLILGK